MTTKERMLIIGMRRAVAALVAAAILTVLLTVAAMAQANQCWYYVNGVLTYNPACSQVPTSPLSVAVGKRLTVDKTIELDASNDNAKLNIGTGGTLGTAAFTNASQYQPSGGGGNASAYYGGALTIGTGTDYVSVTINTGLGFSSNMLVLVSYISDATQYMYGYVHTYNVTTGAITITVTNTGGSGAWTGWNISVAGAIGATGAAGVSSAPIGSMFMWPATTPPAGYLLAQGQCVSTSAPYNSLYAEYGSTWNTAASRGASVDCTAGTFGLPNMQARLPLGAGTGNTAEGGGAGTARTLATVGGAETHTQALAELAAHTHTSTPFGVYGSIAGESGAATGIIQGYSPVNWSTTGSSAPMAIMNPYTVLNYIIRYQ